MQDRYTGDIGDFGKYALLRGLTADGLRLGVLWYLNDLQEHNRDGGFVEYAHLKDCDPDLYDKLDAIRKRTRGVAAVKASDILPAQTDYHSKPLDDGSSREKWFKDAKTEIAGSELVFVDPDTGIAPASLRPLSSKSVKYVLWQELESLYTAGKSLIIYQHQDRRPGGMKACVSSVVDKFVSLRPKPTPLALAFRRQSVRIYFIVPNRPHQARLEHLCDTFLKGPWQPHFTREC